MTDVRAYDMPDWLQALRRLQHRAKKAGKRLHWVQAPTRALHGNVIRHIAEDDQQIIVTAQIPGLYGAMGTTPDYFTNQVIHYRDQVNSLRDFLDIFNHRFAVSLFDIWDRNQPLLNNPLSVDNPADMLIRSLGLLPDDSGQATFLRCAARHHVGLFQHPARTKSGMYALLGAFFPGLQTKIEGHVPRKLPIPLDQQTRLDSTQPPRLGSDGNVLAGESLPDIKGKIRIHFEQLDYRTYLQFMDGESLRQRLVTLVAEYTGDRWACGLELALRAKEVPYWRLGSAQRLGANCWLLSATATHDKRTRFGSIHHG